MIITPVAYGRMANRLLLAAHWIANSEETGVCYAHLRFGHYSRYFEKLRRKPALFYKPHRQAAEAEAKDRAGKKLCKIFDISKTCDLDGGMLDPTSPEFLKLQKSTAFIFTLGWHYRCYGAVAKHRETIKEFFAPAKEYEDRARKFMDAQKKDADMVVGVHVRQTDYADFNGGKWLYGNDTYRNIMEQTAEAFGCRVRFVICSDAEVELSAFGKLDVAPAINHEFCDNLCLGYCDRIIGPPSTYSKWASFIGGVPRLVADKPDVVVAPSAFKIAKTV
jgi:hypothetical protein